ncbi:hypothetical protein ACIF6H_23070 [Streptomyces microflavus]|uniref:hypothetical protein n=1 Tax=Streptomyces TaxID=1883 RepID=UPI001912F8CD|nr:MULTISPECIES: hypothetical protein [unclassified Streptomyces]MBK5994990.1 hypothetical protein [Streptomyces sp. MBT58]MBW3359803.1 hypothetical protein [Streptomyces sp. 09ZI22]MBW3359885.1 hypothetical protein [Streptomyces sp. 09ZI22]
MELTDFIVVVGAATASVLAAAVAYSTLRIASRSRRSMEDAHIRAPQRTNITIEGNGRMVSISDAQLLTSEQFAELRKIIENDVPTPPQEQDNSTRTGPPTRTDEVDGV